MAASILLMFCGLILRVSVGFALAQFFMGRARHRFCTDIVLNGTQSGVWVHVCLADPLQLRFLDGFL